MRNLRFAPAARVDVDDIWDYTVKKWGESQAVKYVKNLHNRIRRLQEFSALGRDRSDIRAGYRSIVSDQHVVFNKEGEDSIIVVRILHRRMQIDHLADY
ncbi:type II toxin-antitoxin system RelE/ParE family toxin [Corynebacterium cystitidis]|uniref:Toxin n=1 Tax=Corynebacterium cystitidis DSM 20524 TaxID=1121357 RepID=A0A1H9UV74_9CORY|nr:type II toxin-antitoxin system RelE/ParE family toxin [Corynebacterium cystitidis]WJY83708.1 Toxin ParE1 [Corynebacterium cystitidis DSM 20524]SES13034.1 toxin ParE1/3/4 [Corynebacterium cystitidis DSM 20524]SNV91218.1 Toxin ParE1 [Corynebacterium cystitidis]